MSHAIFNERFATLRRPAWHGLGLVLQEEVGAVEALQAIHGDYQVTLESLYAEVAGKRIELPNRTILRHPTQDDPEFVPFGVVSTEYNLITPSDVCSLWDARISRPIETIGALHQGRNFFLTCALPEIDVKGDEVERYLGITCPMDGVKSATVEVWPLRVVCQNTLRVAQQRATTSYRIVHDEKAKERMGDWLVDAYESAVQKAEALKEVFDLLASTRVTPKKAGIALEAVFPDGNPPRKNAPDEVMEKRMAEYDWFRSFQARKRERALALFEGDGTGMNTVAAKDTAWGLYNAAAELALLQSERRRRPGDDRIIAEQVTFGTRGAEISKAYSVCVELAKGKANSAKASLN